MNIKIFENLIDYGVVVILLLLGFISLWAYIERLLFFKSIDLKKYKSIEELELDLNKRVSLIGSIAENAPYIGLLGTVLAIMLTFYTIGLSQEISATKIMTSLALALKATAVGLVVAIPSMFFTNHLISKIEEIKTKWLLLRRGA